MRIFPPPLLSYITSEPYSKCCYQVCTSGIL